MTYLYATIASNKVPDKSDCLKFLIEIHIKENKICIEMTIYIAVSFNLYCDVTSTSLQTSDGNDFTPLTVFMCESLTILEFFFQLQDIVTYNFGIIKNELSFLGFYQCVNPGKSLTNF